MHQLFQAIGKDVPNSINTFNNQQSYENLIKQLAYKENKKIYFQYIHDETILNQQYYALDKTLFVALNNKARIPEWTNGKFYQKEKL